jgi:Tfp pilus assembly protein PilE
MSSYTRVGVIIMITLVSITMIGATIIQQRVLSATEQTFEQKRKAAAPIATSDDNAYVAWWSNKTGNDDVMFKASTDGGKTWSNKVNLSNTPKSDSQDVQIAADGNNIYVTWWERNQTANEPVLRVSNDNGKTFGEKIMLSEK